MLSKWLTESDRQLTEAGWEQDEQYGGIVWTWFKRGQESDSRVNMIIVQDTETMSLEVYVMQTTEPDESIIFKSERS